MNDTTRCRVGSPVGGLRLDGEGACPTHRSGPLRKAMHSGSRLRLSCSVALLSVWLASVWLTACGNTVLVGGACAEACGEEHPEGVQDFKVVSGQCVCNDCSAACSKSVCGDAQMPSDVCLPCVQEGLQSDMCHDAGLWNTGCPGNGDCGKLVKCLLACPR